VCNVIVRTKGKAFTIQVDGFHPLCGFTGGGERAERAVTGITLLVFLLPLLLKRVSLLPELFGFLFEACDFSALLLELGIVEKATGREE
jgi:hypothetical protein